MPRHIQLLGRGIWGPVDWRVPCQSPPQTKIWKLLNPKTYPEKARSSLTAGFFFPGFSKVCRFFWWDLAAWACWPLEGSWKVQTLRIPGPNGIFTYMDGWCFMVWIYHTCTLCDSFSFFNVRIPMNFRYPLFQCLGRTQYTVGYRLPWEKRACRNPVAISKNGWVFLQGWSCPLLGNVLVSCMERDEIVGRLCFNQKLSWELGPRILWAFQISQVFCMVQCVMCWGWAAVPFPMHCRESHHWL